MKEPLVMETSDMIALVSLIVSAIALLYTLATNTKRFELTDQYRKELLVWYQDTIRIVMSLLGKVSAGGYEPIGDDTLAMLSAQIEIGRFYLPNYETGYGEEKPLAYRGNRHPALDCLVNIYWEILQPVEPNQEEYLRIMQRRFTSTIFMMIDPRKWNEERAKNISMAVPTDYTINEFHKSYETV